MIFAAILAGVAMGILVGLFGSGGSIIALPALMYLLDIAPKPAIAMSLGIVAVTATLSAWEHWRRGNVDLRIAFVFGLFGAAGTFAGARLGVMTPVPVQLTLFALVMYVAAWKMLKPRPTLAGTGGPTPAQASGEVKLGHIAVHGIGVGVLTGVVGVGGGFMIVSALALLSGLPMKLAIGTSLAIVAAKSYAGFAGYLGSVAIDWNTMGAFTTVTVAGSVIGTRLAHRFSQAMLMKYFAGLLIAVASYILIKSLLVP